MLTARCRRVLVVTELFNIAVNAHYKTQLMQKFQMNCVTE